MKKLIDVMPYEFARQFDDTRAYRLRNVEVTVEHGKAPRIPKAWPGREKNVYFWVELANGYAVGWNENQSRGWSFPVVKMR